MPDVQLPPLQPVMEIEGLAISLADGTPIVSNLGIHLGWGERLLIEGKSGCGKSTFVRALRDLWPYSAKCSRMPAASKVGPLLAAVLSCKLGCTGLYEASVLMMCASPSVLCGADRGCMDGALCCY